MNIITSLSNEKIKSIKKLKEKKYRDKELKYIVEGEHMVFEALEYSVVELLILEQSKITKYDVPKDIDTVYVSKNVMESICDTKTPQGICAVCKIVHDKPLSNKIIILNKLQDPGNLGTIIRTADAFSFDVCLDKDCADIYNPKTLRSTMGSIYHISINRVQDLKSKIESLKQDSYKIYAACLEGEYIYNTNFPKNKLCIVIGNEGQGVDKEIIDVCTDKCTIPMTGKSESLNAGVAASIIMYDISRKENINE